MRRRVTRGVIRRDRGMPCARLPLRAAVVCAAAAVVVAGGLAGCESSPTPTGSVSATASMSPSGSPSPSVSPSPSASASVEIPAAAREKSDKGAEAFVRYFFDQVNVAWTTPRAGLIPRHSDAGCKSCASLESTAEKLEAKNQRYESKPVSVRTTRSVAGAPSGQHFVDVELVQNQVDVVDATGSVVSTDTKAKFSRTVALTWKDDRWFVYDMA